MCEWDIRMYENMEGNKDRKKEKKGVREKNSPTSRER